MSVATWIILLGPVRLLQCFLPLYKDVKEANHICVLGFELLTKKRILNERPEVERLSPMTHDEFQQYVDDDGRVLEVDQLKQRIFRGVSE